MRGVITRKLYLGLRTEPVPASSTELETLGFAVLRGVFDADQIATLRADIDRMFEEFPPDVRVQEHAEEHWLPFRYEMLNRSGVSQRAVADPAILQVIEPLLGEDCHVIANTAWRQPPEESSHGGRYWHIDSGPHVPRSPEVPWDSRIPYPIFAVAAHLMLQDCPIEAGPTAVIPGSHTSGHAPPSDRLSDEGLTWEGHGAVPLTLAAGDVALFVSDVWHRRLPSGVGDPGRYFLQCHYGRRDLAQRLRSTSDANQLSAEAVERARSPRDRTLVGLHPARFYDG